MASSSHDTFGLPFQPDPKYPDEIIFVPEDPDAMEPTMENAAKVVQELLYLRAILQGKPLSASYSQEDFHEDKVLGERMDCLCYATEENEEFPLLSHERLRAFYLKWTCVGPQPQEEAPAKKRVHSDT